MSCWGGSGKDNKSGDIDKKLKDQKKKDADLLTVLFTGAGNSGKSTFARQLCSLFPDTTREKDERESLMDPLFINILLSARMLLEQCALRKVQMPDGVQDKEIESVLKAEQLTPPVAQIIEKLYQHEPFIQVLDKFGGKMALPCGIDGTHHILKNVMNYQKPGYKLTTEDILKVRRKTTGIVEYHIQFTAKEKQFAFPMRLIDVGGQRSERKKWLSAFNGVHCVIYMVALNEYDIGLEEDENVNRMVDTLSLWHFLTGSPHLAKTPFMLFLNKSDLFAKKIEDVPLQTVFQDFAAFSQKPSVQKLTPYEQSYKYFAAKFNAKYQGEGELFIHLTSAVDPSSCTKVWGTLVAEIHKQSRFADKGII